MASVNIKLNPFGITLIIAVVALLCLYKLRPFTFTKPEMVDMRELMSVSIDLAEKGGNEILTVKNTEKEAKSKGKTKEGADEFVTKADKNSHKVITAGFKKVYGNTLIVKSEEGDINDEPITSSIELNNKEIFQKIIGGKVPKSDITIWVDPLDATQEYTEDLNKYVSTMICIAVRGVPKFGVVHFPYGTENKKTYWGYVNERKVSNNLKEPPLINPGHKFIISRSHRGPNVEKIIQETFGKNTSIELAGGAGYKTIQVVTGGATAYVHYTIIKKWDICAGNAIANAMGGHMTTMTNEDIDYSISSGSIVNKKGLLSSLTNHDQIFSKLKESFTEK